MKRLRWSLAAAADLEGIHNYLCLHHPAFAVSTMQRLYSAAKSLKNFPFAGRAGRKAGTRELALPPLPYVLIYSVDEESVNILRFLHTARDWQ